MRKFLMFAGSLVVALGFAGAAKANEPSTAECLAKYGTHILPSQVRSVDRECRPLLFPPQPQFKNGLFQLGGEKVRAHALACSNRYGAVTNAAAVGDGSCLVFYFPADLHSTRVRIKLPAGEGSGLYF